MLDNRDSWRFLSDFIKVGLFEDRPGRGGYRKLDAWRFVGIMVLNLLQ